MLESLFLIIFRLPGKAGTSGLRKKYRKNIGTMILVEKYGLFWR